jgi:chromosome segregation ATPase
MNTNDEILRLKNQISKLNLKITKLEQSVKDIKKTIERDKKLERKRFQRKFSLIDRKEAEERLKNLMMPE